MASYNEKSGFDEEADNLAYMRGYWLVEVEMKLDLAKRHALKDFLKERRRLCNEDPREIASALKEVIKRLQKNRLPDANFLHTFRDNAHYIYKAVAELMYNQMMEGQGGEAVYKRVRHLCVKLSEEELLDDRPSKKSRSKHSRSTSARHHSRRYGHDSPEEERDYSDSERSYSTAARRSLRGHRELSEEELDDSDLESSRSTSAGRSRGNEYERESASGNRRTGLGGFFEGRKAAFLKGWAEGRDR